MKHSLIGFYFFAILANAVFVLNSCAPKTTTEVRGTPGITGATGGQGANGHDGEDATPVTVVQLCPGHSTYPSVFLEYAICLQGQLYGVYSSNGGFLALLPPGTYSSNAIGSACTLTIGTNCEVSN